MKQLGLLMVFCLLSACATMSLDECKSASWYDIGYSDAIKGKQILLSGHGEACAELNIKPDNERYMAGYETGSQEFCTYDNGLRFGKKGKNANNICVASNLGKEFFAGYDKGKKVYELGEEVKGKEAELAKIDKQLKKIRKGKVELSAGEIELLYRKKELINREIHLLENEIVRIEERI